MATNLRPSLQHHQIPHHQSWPPPFREHLQLALVSDACQNSHFLLSLISSSLTPCSIGKLPLLNSLKRNVQNVRHVKYQGNLRSATSRSDLVLPDAFVTLENGENFLLFDSGNNMQRIIIFGTAQGLDILGQAEHWFCDGTFKASPALFDQLFIVQGRFRDSILPLLYVLMPNRTQSSYNRVLTALGNLRPNLAPATIMSDFERASINAFHDSYPAAQQRGCFFHFSQSVWRHIQQDSVLLHEYREKPDFALQMKMLAALAFLPPEKVPTSYDKLVGSSFFEENYEILRQFLNYFESTWISSFNRRRERQPPIFAVALWNCRQSVLDGLGKTNNACEGFNRAINSMLGAAHPTIFKLLDCLKKQQELTRAKIERIFGGGAEDVGRDKYKESADRLKKIVEEYEYKDETLLDHLRGVAHNT